MDKGDSKTGLSDSDIKTILSTHNSYRDKQGASNMALMVS